MSQQVIHYDDWDGGTEADQDHPDTLFCGTKSGAPELTPYKDQITCKRCLKILTAAKTDRMLEDQKYKAELYDEVWQKARDMGHMNVSMALKRLAEYTTPPDLPELNADLRFILGRPNFTCHHPAKALRLMGQDIAAKSEEEQAATIYWMLGHYFKDPAAWRENGTRELKAAATADKA